MSKEKVFINKLDELQDCQKSKSLDSCMRCDKFLKCDLRKEYVLSAYKSMNEDMNKGGFNF